MNKICAVLRCTNIYNIKTKKEYIIRTCSRLTKPNQDTKLITFKSVIEEVNWENELSKLEKEDEDTILTYPKEDLSHVTPYFKPSFNFAAYVDKSDTLQKLVKLGVNLHKIEKKKLASEIVLKLDFENDIRKYILFLNDQGIEDLGKFITINPFIFKETIDDLTIRINYLESKSFSKEMIYRIINKNPFWLNFSTQRIDSRLGYFQNTFNLTGDEVRWLAISQPRLITYNIQHINLNTFSVKEEMGFTDKQIKTLLLSLPKLWMMSQDSILEKFNYLHNTMNITHDQLLLTPQVFRCRKSRIKQRHQFLLKLRRAQFDPKKENYISLDRLCEGSDSEFCSNIAKSSVEIYNTFLKSL